MPMNRRPIRNKGAAAKRAARAEALLEAAANATTPREAAALCSTARLLLDPVVGVPKLMAPGGILRRAIVAHDAALARVVAARDDEIDKALDVPLLYEVDECPFSLDASHANAVRFLEPLLPDGRNLDFRDLGLGLSMHPYFR